MVLFHLWYTVYYKGFCHSYSLHLMTTSWFMNHTNQESWKMPMTWFEPITSKPRVICLPLHHVTFTCTANKIWNCYLCYEDNFDILKPINTGSTVILFLIFWTIVDLSFGFSTWLLSLSKYQRLEMMQHLKPCSAMLVKLGGGMKRL